jgi:cell wall-associated NlpC family hydrolase
VAGSQGIGWGLVGVGAWVITCGYLGLDPLQTVVKIIQNPGNATNIMRSGGSAIGSKSSSSAANSGGSKGAQVVSFAASKIGQPYVFGGHANGGWDCSGLTMEAYKTVGISLPHSSMAQLLIGKKIGLKSDLQPGDLIFPSLGATLLGDHVQIYAGTNNGVIQIIEAAMPGTNVRQRSAWGLPSGNSVRATRPGG